MRLITVAAAGLLFASTAIAQIPTGAAYQQLCAQHGVPPEQCRRGPSILDGNFDMKTCLNTPLVPTQRLSQQARCNLVADCFRKKDPFAYDGECARGYAAGIPFNYDPQHALANPPTRDQLFEQQQQQVKHWGAHGTPAK
jgi:hypothetical protein